VSYIINSFQEEREVLLSIYEGDENFFDISPTQYQYKVIILLVGLCLLLPATKSHQFSDAHCTIWY